MLQKFKKPLVLSTMLGAALLAIGLVLLVEIIRSRESNLTITPPATSLPAQPKGANYIGGEPVNISIPSLEINLPVIPGYYDKQTQTWTLTINDVQYATMTPQPNNQGGDTFLYGHYRPNIFATLHDIHSGAKAMVTTANHHMFYYQLASVRVVNPNDSSSIFNYKGKPILTVQTCTGLFFQNRQLFTFELIKVA